MPHDEVMKRLAFQRIREKAYIALKPGFLSIFKLRVGLSDFFKNNPVFLKVKSFLKCAIYQKGYTTITEFKNKIKGIETQMIQQEVLERLIKDKITDKMVEDEYKTLVANLKGQEEVKTSHILVDTEEQAKEIKKKLNKGSNFADLVKEFSKDEGSKANGGEIGYVLKGQLVPEYEGKAFTLKKMRFLIL